jgi:tape measure domain-containing protein
VSSIDERIVEMTFQSADFVKNVANTVTALDNLKNKLNFKGAEDSLNSLDSAGKKFSLSGMGAGIDAIASKFSAMGVAGIAVLSNLVNRAVNAGLALAKGLTITPILAGLDVYETKINAIQTILANTQSQGTTLNQVTAALQELNVYANKTVFSFADMTKNIGTFTAAGVDLNTSVSSIKGIANLAALSGASADQASNAMYQLSQAIASGSVKLQDWNSVVNAGLGGKTFQTALENTARAAGTNIDAIIKKAGSFRQSLQEGWLTSDVLTKTLSQFTGDLSAAQIKAMGFTDQQAQQILALGKTAVASAVNIRTITQLMAALHEEVATAWSTVWETLIGNIGQATSLLTGVHNILEGALTQPIYNLNKLLQGFVALGGRTELIHAISDAFSILNSFLKPIGQAFRDIFPPTTAIDLMNIVLAFENFEDAVRPSPATIENIRKTFDGLFSVLKIGEDVVKGVFTVIGTVFSAIAGGSGGVLQLTGNVGSMVTKFKDTIESGNGLSKFFQTLGNVIASPIKLVLDAAGGFNILGTAVQKAWDVAQPVVGNIAKAFGSLGNAIGQSVQNGSFANVVNTFNQVVLGGILLAIKKFIGGLGEGSGGGGLFASIKESFEGLTGALQAMQTNLKSGTLEKIALAVALLTASIIALSFVNIPNLTKGLTAITVEFTDLIASMAVIDKLSGATGIVKLPVIAASLILLSGAILILSTAVVILGHLSWTEIAKGLSAIAVLLGELVVTVALLSSDTAGLYSTAIAMEVMAVAMNIMAGAVGKLGSMDFATLAKGTITIAALLLIISGFNAISAGGLELITTAAAMVVVAGALNILAIAIGTLGSMSISELAKGLVSIAAALLIMAAGLILMTEGLPGAAALIVASTAIVILSTALQNMAGLSWQDIAQALVTLAGSLLIIAAALIVMELSLPGAAALIVAAGALAILAPVLVVLSTIPWEGIAKSLVALAGAFIVIGLAGLVLTPLIPSLLGLGAAITLLGVGILAAGIGVAAFGVGLTALAISGGAAFTVLVAGIHALLAVVPDIITTFGRTITQLANAIGTAAPAILRAFTAIMTALLNAVITLTPRIAQAATVLITGILTVLSANAPRIVSVVATMMVNILNAIASRAGALAAAGVNVIVAVLNGISANVGRVVAAAANMVINFINAIGAAGLRITAAGAAMIINFINGLANQINAEAPALRQAGLNLAEAIINGMTGGLLSGGGSIISAAESVASSALHSALSFLGIHSPSKVFDEQVGQMAALGISVGLLKMADNVGQASSTVAQRALDSLKDGLSNIDSLVSDNVNLQPTITPVIDLTQAQKGFSDLSALTKSQLISADTSNIKATSISADNAAAAAAAGLAPATGSAVSFTQINNSPKALDAATIYRQTNNQLSVVKGALPKLCSPK